MVADHDVERPDLLFEPADLPLDPPAGPARGLGIAVATKGVGDVEFIFLPADGLGEDGAFEAQVGHGADELVDGDLRPADLGEEGVGDVDDAHAGVLAAWRG